MSDSLLTLLEILDQVVQEEELNEQESSGLYSHLDTQMTEEKLKNELIKISSDVIKKIISNIANDINEGKHIRPSSRSPNSYAKDKIGPVWRFEYAQSNVGQGYSTQKNVQMNEVIQKYLNIETSRDPNDKRKGITTATPKEVDPWQGKSQDWDSLFKRFINQLLIKGKKINENELSSKVITLFNSLMFAGLAKNAENEGSFTLSDEFLKVYTENENVALFSLPGRNALDFTVYNGAGVRKKKEGLVRFILKYLNQGKAYYNTVVKEKSRNTTTNFFIADEQEAAKLNSIDDRYILDNKLLEVFKKQLLTGNIDNFVSLIKIKDDIAIKNESLANAYRLKLSEIIKQFATNKPILVRSKLLPYLEKHFPSLIDELPELKMKPKQDPSFTRPAIKTSGGQLSSDFANTIEIFMEDATGFDERLQKYVQKMKMFSNTDLFNQEIKTINPVDFLNRVVLLDYFVEFSKGFSAPVAGNIFEYFLSGLLGGEVIGEEGGVVDIKLDDKFISAKLLSPSSFITQSEKGFEKFKQDEDKSITYIVGRKKRDQIDTASGSRNLKQSVNPLEIVEVDLYKFEAQFLGLEDVEERTKKGTTKTTKKAKFMISNENDSQEVFFGRSRGKIIFYNIDRYIGQPFSTIPIISGSDADIKTYRQALKNKLNSPEEESNASKIKKILNKVQEIFDNIKEGEISARDYVNTGNREKGTEAVEKLNSSTGFIDEMMNTLNYGTESQNQEDS